jgi:hypothetical protein
MVLAGAVSGVAALKQSEPMTSVSVKAPASAHSGKSFNVKLTLSVPAGFHIYSPLYKGDTGVPVSIKGVDLPAGVSLKAPKAPAGDTLTGQVILTVPVSVASSVHGKKALKLKVRYQQCNDRICLPPQNLFVNVNVSFN